MTTCNLFSLTLTNMRIVGIDPGYDRLGIAVIEKENGKETLLFSDCITTHKEDAPEMRLKTIADGCRDIIETYKPHALGIESLFFKKNQTTGIKVAESRGVVLNEAARIGIPVFEYSPPTIKLAVTGHGASDKKQVMNMVPRLVKIEKEIKYDDEYDAIAVALTCIAHENRNINT